MLDFSKLFLRCCACAWAVLRYWVECNFVGGRHMQPHKPASCISWCVNANGFLDLRILCRISVFHCGVYICAHQGFSKFDRSPAADRHAGSLRKLMLLVALFPWNLVLKYPQHTHVWGPPAPQVFLRARFLRMGAVFSGHVLRTCSVSYLRWLAASLLSQTLFAELLGISAWAALSRAARPWAGRQL